MRIIILGTAHPLRGGLAAYNERIAKAFQDEGHEVDIVTFSMQYPGFLFPGKSQYSDEPAPQDLRIKVWLNSINPFNWLWVAYKIRQLKPDLMVVKFWLPFMGPCFGTVARLVKWGRSTKVVSIIDNIIPHEKRPGDRFFTQYFVSAIDRFVVMSRSVGEDMKQFVRKQPVAYVPHPVYDNYGPLIPREQGIAKLKLDSNTRYILFFGFVRAYKGLDLLLHAMADPRFADANIKLIVAGEYYTDKQTYTDIIQQKGIADRVIEFDEFISDSEVGNYFSVADLVVQPYKSATQSGISQMAYHFEKPMVVTNVGGLPEIVPHGECGYVVEPEPIQIADAILDFYQNDKAAQLLPGVQKMKKAFSWENMCEAVRRAEC